MHGRVTALLIGSFLAAAVALGAQAQPPAQPGQQGGKPTADMMAKCKDMMAMREKMMADMKTADARLNELVSKMNAASGQAKVDATAAVVTQLVEQRSAMRDRMMGMQQGMMGHMMEHAQAGPQSMAACPMMKMGGMKHE
jgi:hypothetical protein